MAKVFVKKTGSSTTVSNLPIPDGVTLELTAEEMEMVNGGKHTFDLDKTKLKFTKIVKEKSPEQVAKESLKAKLEAGTATEADVKEALKLLL